MPLGNGTGPQGMGSMTGRAAGFCAGFNVPGYMNQTGGGYGAGFGGRGRGFGRGRGVGFGNFIARKPVVNQPNFPVYNGAYNQESETEYLKNTAQHLENSLSSIKERLAELEKNNKQK